MLRKGGCQLEKYVLVIGASPEASREIRRNLEDSATQVLCTATREDAIAHLLRHKFILVIMEFGYVGPESRTLFQSLRKKKPVPILILYANADIAGGCAGSDSDEILTSPFGVKGWIIRAKEYVRQHTRLDEHGDRAYILACGQDLVLNPVTRMASLRGEVLDLSTKQFDMLYFMASHPGQVLSKDQLFNYLWDEPNVGVDNSVALYISKLRKKLGEDPGEPSFIHTIRGIGYKFTKE